VKTTINFTRIFEGPLHDRCYAIWEDFSEHTGLEVIQHDNYDGLEHWEMLALMWERMRARQDVDRVIITEHDFLPTPDLAERAQEARGGAAALGVEYAPQQWKTLGRRWQGIPGGWFLEIDRTRFSGPLDFRGEGLWNDPGNKLHHQLNLMLAPGQIDEYGLKYPWGTHLFWSRHIEEKGRNVQGFEINKIREYWEKRLTEWEDAIEARRESQDITRRARAGTPEGLSAPDLL